MKVGIITINDNTNYGNRLQNYAVQRILEENGIQAETIRNKVNPSTTASNKTIFQKIKGKINNIIYKKKMQYKIQKFEEFNNRYINATNYIITQDNIKKGLNDEYDYFIVGSDQVWNPNWRLSNIDLLSFVESKKRIAFSASFGVEEIPSEKKDEVARELKKFKVISVREDRGKEIAQELTKRDDVEVLIDPTMMLTKEQWNQIIEKPKQLKYQRYILLYFLGEMSKDIKKKINRIAKENDCKVVNILDKRSKFYGISPSEFVYLEKNAFLVCTDSFHASVFAILFDTSFIIFNRKGSISNMNSRIDTLLNKLKLQNRRYDGKITNKNLEHDYTKSYVILEEERKKALSFLKNSIT